VKSNIVCNELIDKFARRHFFTKMWSIVDKRVTEGVLLITKTVRIRRNLVI